MFMKIQLTTPSNATATTAEITITRATLSLMKSILSGKVKKKSKKHISYRNLIYSLTLLVLFLVTKMTVAKMTDVMNMAPPASDLSHRHSHVKCEKHSQN